MGIKLPVESFPCTPVWYAGGGENNEYGDFLLQTQPQDGHKYTLRISCDTDYNIFADGRLCGFGRYSDYPEQLVYDEYDLSWEKELLITAWHSGVDCFNYKHQAAYVAFALFDNGELCESSCPGTLSRICPRYVPHVSRLITGQLGAGFDMQCGVSPADYQPSVPVPLEFDAVRPRPNEKLVLCRAIECSLVKSGFYMEADPSAMTDSRGRILSPDCAVRQEFAILDPQDGKPDGKYYLFDIGREEVGFPEIEFETDAACTAGFGWGEHIKDGMCRVRISTRRFASEFHAVRGHNVFFQGLRRQGGRYMQLFIPGESRNVKMRFYPTVYPVEVLPSGLDGLRRKIYDVSVHTLRCSMHEHYEDCPWREQALYTLDSRNQILCGYRAFEGGNLKMVRSSLDLISRGVRHDGLTKLCSPSGNDYPIPFFTLVYFLEMRDYLNFSGDADFLREKLGVLEILLSAVLARRITSGPMAGLCPRYPESGAIWNFYEWSPTMDGAKYGADEINPPCEAPFNAVLILALEALAEIYAKLGLRAKEQDCTAVAASVRSALIRVFRRADGCFESFTDRKAVPLSVLNQAFCVLAGAADRKNMDKILEIIADNGGYEAVPATLSMYGWRYDALIENGREKYSRTILGEIDRTFGYMLDAGATTFWETIKGEADFSKAGSLCHGWSALPVYYYRLLLGL